MEQLVHMISVSTVVTLDYVIQSTPVLPCACLANSVKLSLDDVPAENLMN
jgi:hypothetical protein